MKAEKHAIACARLSCRKFGEDDARLELSIMAYNSVSIFRRAAFQKRIRDWPLRCRQNRLGLPASGQQGMDKPGANSWVQG